MADTTDGGAKLLTEMDNETLAFTAQIVGSCLAADVPSEPNSIAALLTECARRLKAPGWDVAVISQPMDAVPVLELGPMRRALNDYDTEGKPSHGAELAHAVREFLAGLTGR